MPTVENNTMILSKKTHEILKNFASINPSICITEGNKIVTLSQTKNIMAEAEIDEKFDQTVRIYDLNRFLSSISLIQNPELTFNEDMIFVSGSSGSKIKFPLSDPAIVQAVTKKLSMPAVVAKLDISAQRIAELLKASAVMQLPNLKIKSKGEDTAVAVLYDKSDPSSSEYTVELQADFDQPFSVSFKVETLKLIPGDYVLEISKNIVSRFTHKTEDIKYFIAMDYKSSDEQE
jgi:hypothetical protein